MAYEEGHSFGTLAGEQYFMDVEVKSHDKWGVELNQGSQMVQLNSDQMEELYQLFKHTIR
ncbi:hypothetical protein [Yersinia phage MHG19]|nr:hypothetical protein [Yersinia phage MHG19]